MAKDADDGELYIVQRDRDGNVTALDKFFETYTLTGSGTPALSGKAVGEKIARVSCGLSTAPRIYIASNPARFWLRVRRVPTGNL